MIALARVPFDLSWGKPQLRLPGVNPDTSPALHGALVPGEEQINSARGYAAVGVKMGVHAVVPDQAGDFDIGVRILGSRHGLKDQCFHIRIAFDETFVRAK